MPFPDAYWIVFPTRWLLRFSPALHQPRLALPSSLSTVASAENHRFFRDGTSQWFFTVYDNHQCYKI
jgi:hypothetical protein